MPTGMPSGTFCLTTHANALARYSNQYAGLNGRSLVVQDRFVAAQDRTDTHNI